MLGATVVPQRKGIRLPFDATCQARCGRNVRYQGVQQRSTLPIAHTLNVGCEAAVDVQHLFAGLWMGHDHRMFIARIFLASGGATR